MVKQILLNLLSNAVKFTGKGGRVMVRAAVEDSVMLLTVADTGVGIHEADIAKVMAPFEQVDNLFTREHTGTGLGVPLVRELVALHGGTFTIDSVPDTRTTITVRFPAERIIPLYIPLCQQR